MTIDRVNYRNRRGPDPLSVGGVRPYQTVKERQRLYGRWVKESDLDEIVLGHLTRSLGYGDGSDGDFDSAGDVVLEVPPDGGPIVKQYRYFRLNPGHKLTVSNPCRGLIILVQKDAHINGIIDMSGKAARIPRNPNGMAWLDYGQVVYIQQLSKMLVYELIPAGGAGGAGGMGGRSAHHEGGIGTDYNGGSGGPGGSNAAFGGGCGGGGGGGGGSYVGGSWWIGGGGGGGGAGNGGSGGRGGGSNGGTGASGSGGSIGWGSGGAGGSGGSGTSGAPSGQAGSAGQSGGGGGILVIIAGGAVTITGQILANGVGSGGNGAPGSYYVWDGSFGYWGASGGGGGGGGCGGGVVFIKATTKFTNTGSIQVNGSNGGSGGSGPSGAQDGSPGQPGQAGTIRAGVL